MSKKLFLVAIMASFAVPSVSKELKVFGNWGYVINKNKATNETEVYIASEAVKTDSQYGFAKPFFGLNCNRLYFGGLDVLSGGTFVFRTDKMTTPSEFYGSVWEGSDGVQEALFIPSFFKPYKSRVDFWSDYKNKFVNMRKDSFAYVSFDSYSRADQVVTFSLKGFTEAVDKLAELCSQDMPLNLK